MTRAVFMKTPGGEELAVLPRGEYEAMLDGLEDRADRASIEELRRTRAEGRLVAIPADVVLAIAEGENRVKVLRVWRGMTQAALATAAGITSTYLSRVENGTDAGNKARRAIAAALEVPETMLLEK